MNHKIITAKSIVALAAAALIAGGALAAPKLNSTRSNSYRLDVGNPNAEKHCVTKGGSVKDGICVIPSSGGTAQPVEATSVKSSKSNSSERQVEQRQQDLGTSGTTTEKTICIIYKPGHEGDDRYCSQSVPAPK